MAIRFSSAPNPLNPRDLDITIQYNFCGKIMSSEDTRNYHMR